MPIPRYDPNWDERVSQMELHPSGDYVEFSDHETLVDELHDRITELEKAINDALEALNRI